MRSREEHGCVDREMAGAPPPPPADRCDDCGFVYDLDTAPQVPALLSEYAQRYRELLSAPVGALARRPAPDVWSPLEYACHVRDVLIVQRERLLAARRTDDPVAEPMGRDERAEHDGYAQQRPADVARQLADAAALLRNALERLTPQDWQRTLVYNYPQRAQRSLRWLAVHTLHELHHHLQDARRS